MQDIRWKPRFDNLQSAYRKLQQAVAANALAPDNELFRMALVKAFEMTFELAWKTMKDYLEFNGIDAARISTWPSAAPPTARRLCSQRWTICLLPACLT